MELVLQQEGHVAAAVGRSDRRGARSSRLEEEPGTVLLGWCVCPPPPVLVFSAGWGSSQQQQQPTTVSLLQQVGNLHEGTTMRSVEVCVSALFC